MASYDNFHSRLVAWLKVALPLLALGILSTLFLVSRKVDPERAIPYSDVEVEAILREQRIDSPDYSGMTRDGTAITLAADTARPDTADRVTTEGLRARLETPDGGVLDLRAGAGVIDTGGQRADMTGGVRIETSTGYVIDTVGLSSSLDATDLQTDGGITATGPLGELTAGQMALRQGEVADGPAYVLVFKGGVHLIYRPKPTQGGGQ